MLRTVATLAESAVHVQGTVREQATVILNQSKARQSADAPFVNLAIEDYMRPFPIFLALLSLAPLHVALSQDIASLRAGESIRVSVNTPGSQRVEGRLVSLSPDTVVLRSPTTALAIPLSDLSLLEVKRRSGGSFMKSVAFGLLGGVLGGAILGAASGNTNTGDGILTAGDKAVIGSVLGGAVGLIGGTAWGACCASSWHAIPLPRRP